MLKEVCGDSDCIHIKYDKNKWCDFLNRGETSIFYPEINHQEVYNYTGRDKCYIKQQGRARIEKSILIKDEYDIVNARSAGKQIAAEIGLGLVDQSRIATAVSELARNMVVYATSGVIALHQLDDGVRRGLEIMAVDSGPGIADIEMAMRDGYTTGGGLGVGLPGTKRLMDEFEIDSEVGKGTTITIRKWRR